jgi:hypothetical protein
VLNALVKTQSNGTIAESPIRDFFSGGAVLAGKKKI